MTVKMLLHGKSTTFSYISEIRGILLSNQILKKFCVGSKFNRLVLSDPITFSWHLVKFGCVILFFRSHLI